MSNSPEFDRNPVLPLEQMSGAEIPRVLAHLTSLAIDGFRFGEHQFRTVTDRVESHDGWVHAVCEAEDGTQLLLDYNSTDSTVPVNYSLLSVEKAS